MKGRNLHPWNVSAAEAAEIQRRLSPMATQTWDGRAVRAVAGADVAFPDKSTVLAAVVVLTYPDLEVVERGTIEARCSFPYVPGLLAFREAPALLEALGRLRTAFDLLMCDGQGLAHPRGMGLATHVGILIDEPVLGCAKSVLYGRFEEPPRAKGSSSYMVDRSSRTVGAALRTRDGVRPVYVSVGNRIDLATAIKIVLGCSPRYRIPEPLRLAHKLSVGGKES